MVVLDHVEVEGGSILKGSQAPPVPESRLSLKGSPDSSKTTKVVIESELAKEVGPLQKRDGSDLAKIRSLVENDIEPSPESVTMGSEEYRKLAGMIPRMIIEDDMLRVKLNVGGRPRTVIICPVELRPVIIRDAHV